MSFRFFDKLSQDFTGLLDDKEDCNVIIEVDQNPNKKLFLAHSNVLRYRSSYFRAELVNTHKNEDNVKTLIEPHISFQIFDIILKIVTTPKLPNRIVVKEPFSTIITDEHAAEITSWIDRKGTASAYSPRSIPYNFQLILRGSRDGFHPQTFWNMCHSHANTVVVLKVAGTDEILGGYNPLAWDKKAKKRYIQTRDKEMALIYCDEIVQHKYGPYFGNCYLMMRTEASDFTKDKGSWCNGSSLFEMPIRTTSERFSITDYEVFKVVHRRT
ncbi:948_t:CDS:2 [Acaulospora colombiana]|uniref:948_t:CDS:1 n=1 Tax=Acaulospora colombiana TaxID=27376 RepID=A0ACA9K877_9GLOM|nr:948_t:CDS:2 [Acaulospora colombiana]